MTVPTFTPPRLPDAGTRNKPELKINVAEFGDGYTQGTPKGINHMRRRLELSWSKLNPTDWAAIIGFLEARGGYQAFAYTPSNEAVPLKWTCDDWSDQREHDGFTVTATFVQSFRLD